MAAPDYRSSQNTLPTVSHNSNLNMPLKQSYASATQNSLFPQKNQAIVLDSIDGIPLKEYVNAIGKITDPANIRFVSRISNSRICIFLSSKQIVENITSSYSKIIIGNNTVSLRPLINSHKRIILSNVCPVIPHEIIEKELIILNVKPMSQISFLRAGLSEPGFSHILSFRRQVFIKLEDVDKLPPSLNIFYEDTSYWIYLSGDNINCYLCKKEGHVAKDCPDSTNKEDNTAMDTSTLSTSTQRIVSQNQSSGFNTGAGMTRLSQILNNTHQGKQC